ncbi:MAG TPA: hypothetical protein VJ399_02735, partial [Patescibacteria group bacterium]|nr:hypothetical protein [Patescibacteria group bacterium]
QEEAIKGISIRGSVPSNDGEPNDSDALFFELNAHFDVPIRILSPLFFFVKPYNYITSIC